MLILILSNSTELARTKHLIGKAGHRIQSYLSTPLDKEGPMRNFPYRPFSIRDLKSDLKSDVISDRHYPLSVRSLSASQADTLRMAHGIGWVSRWDRGAMARRRSEVVMAGQQKPTKEQARHWIEQRAKERKPLPDQKELRRQLGMDLIEAERKQRRD